MDSMLTCLVTSIIETFQKHDVKIFIHREYGRLTLRTDEVMYDVGIAADTIVFDLFYDIETKSLFIGLLRLPQRVRHEGIAKEIVDIVESFAKKNDFVVFVDACEGCEYFWQHLKFKELYRDRYSFDIMGFGGQKDYLMKKWKEFQHTEVYEDNLTLHD